MDRLWPVKLYVYEGEYSSCVVSAGWSAFVRENGLQVGDVCIFELSMRDDVVLKSTFSGLILIKCLLTLHCKSNVGYVLLF